MQGQSNFHFLLKRADPLWGSHCLLLGRYRSIFPWGTAIMG